MLYSAPSSQRASVGHVVAKVRRGDVTGCVTKGAAVELSDVKSQVAVANRVMAEAGLSAGVLIHLGHASMRVPGAPDRFVVKGRGYAIDAQPCMRAEDMIVCDLDGVMVDGPPGATPCFEIKIHSSIYAANPDVHTIVHAHPRFTVVLSVLQKTLVPMCKEGAMLVREPLPVYPHMSLVTSDEEGKELARSLGASPAILMTGHGAVTTGATLEESMTHMVELEEQAKMNWYAYCAAGRDYPGIPDELLDEAQNAAPFWELPHLRDVMPNGYPHINGWWAYNANVVSSRGGL